MVPFLGFHFVFSIINGTFYQIVFNMRNIRQLTSDEMHVSIGMLEKSVAEHLDVSQSVVCRIIIMKCMEMLSGHAKATSDIPDCIVLSKSGLSPAILGKGPGQNWEKMIDLTSKLGEINNINITRVAKYILKIKLF